MAAAPARLALACGARHRPRRACGRRGSGYRRGPRAPAARQRHARVQSFELHGCGGSRRGSARRTCLRGQEGVRRDSFSPGHFMRRLGTLFVERYDTSASLADTENAIAAARQGRNIVFFPEGAFTRRAGLSEFYLGAFKVAAEAGLPVVPGIIRGTRSMLRGDQWFPRWTPLSVTIEEPNHAFRNGLRVIAAVARCRRARSCLHGCGEPDLGELVKPPHPLRGLFEGDGRTLAEKRPAIGPTLFACSGLRLSLRFRSAHYRRRKRTRRHAPPHRAPPRLAPRRSISPRSCARQP